MLPVLQVIGGSACGVHVTGSQRGLWTNNLAWVSAKMQQIKRISICMLLLLKLKTECDCQSRKPAYKIWQCT